MAIPIINFLFERTFLPPEYAVQSVMQAATAHADKVSSPAVALCDAVCEAY